MMLAKSHKDMTKYARRCVTLGWVGTKEILGKQGQMFHILNDLVVSQKPLKASEQEFITVNHLSLEVTI